MTRKDRDTYVLSTGREVSANHGLIGLSDRSKDDRFNEATFGSFEVSEGYDGHLYEIEEWTPAERAELADHMIAMWQAFRVKAIAPGE